MRAGADSLWDWRRVLDDVKFRVIPSGKGYLGQTAIGLDGEREIVCMGVGKDVERLLMEAKNATRR